MSIILEFLQVLGRCVLYKVIDIEIRVVDSIHNLIPCGGYRAIYKKFKWIPWKNVIPRIGFRARMHSISGVPWIKGFHVVGSNQNTIL